MTDIKIDVGEIVGKIKAVMIEIYPDNRAIDVNLTDIKLEKGLSDPYRDIIGDEYEMVSDYVKTAKFIISCEIQHKYKIDPFELGLGREEKL